MPSEIRYIVFRDAEVVQAIQSYLRRMNKPLPAGSILSCGSEQDVSLELTRFRITLAPDLINTEKLNVTERHDVVVTLKRRSLAGLQGILWDASIDLTPVQVPSHCRRIGCYTPFVRPSWGCLEQERSPSSFMDWASLPAVADPLQATIRYPREGPEWMTCIARSSMLCGR